MYLPITWLTWVLAWVEMLRGSLLISSEDSAPSEAGILTWDALSCDSTGLITFFDYAAWDVSSFDDSWVAAQLACCEVP